MLDLSSVKTGDIVLFSDRYWITSCLTRIGTRSRWTHCAMVVRIPGVFIPKNDLLIWEIANGIFSLFDYLSGKVSRGGSRVVSLQAKLKCFPKRGNKVMIMSLTENQDDRDQDEWEDWITGEIMPQLTYWSNVKFRHEICTFIRAALGTKPWLKSIESTHADSIVCRGEMHYSKLFCSEAIAIVYQILGVIDTTYNPKRYVPADFSGRVVMSDERPFLMGWDLQPFLSLNMKFMS